MPSINPVLPHGPSEPSSGLGLDADKLKAQQSQVSDFEDGGLELYEDDEGNVIVSEPELPTADKSGFYDNLVFDLPTSMLDGFAIDFLDKIDLDERARDDRDKMYAEGLKRTGLGGEAPGGANFTGASRTVHPMVTKAVVEYSSRAMKELFPASGPVKSFIPGKATRSRAAKADRVKNFFNWQLRTQVRGFRTTLEQTLTQSGLSGVNYIRFIWDERLKRPTPNSATTDKVLLPFAATDYYSAERITFIDDITEFEYKDRVRAGIYQDIDAMPPSMGPEETRAQAAQNKIGGISNPGMNEDGLRRTYEVNCYLDGVEEELGGDPGVHPYMMLIDKDTRKLLGLVRNWEEGDKKCERMHWMIEWPFVTWQGPYPIGLIHMIGSLSAAATGALRALLDSAHVNNTPTTLKLKGAQVGGQSKQLEPTQMLEVDGGVGADDIRKLMMNIPFNPPSDALFRLLDFLVQSGEAMIRSTFENLTEGNPTAPVGTTYALIEQGLTVVSAIIGRQHHAFERTLECLYRINRMYTTDDEIKNEAGELLAFRSDFQGPMDVIPVSDPGTPTDAHRSAKIQTVAQRSTQMPQVYNLRNVEKLILTKLLRMSEAEAEDLLVPVPQPQEMNAANENLAATLGRPITAFPEQDHLAHIQVHLDYMDSPVFGSLAIIAPQFIPTMLGHLKEHIAMWYVSRVHERLSQALGRDVSDYMGIQDTGISTELDRFIATVSHDIVKDDVNNLAQVPMVIQKAMQLLQSMQPQPQDPNAQAQMQRNQIQAKKNDADAQIKSQQVQQRAKELDLKVVTGREKHQTQMALEESRQQGESQRTGLQQLSAQQIAQVEQANENARSQAQIESKERITTQDNQTALSIAEAEIESGERVAVSKGTAVNKGTEKP